MPRHRRGWAVNEISDNEIVHTPLTTSLVEPALLILVSKNSQHGYALLTEITFLGFESIHQSVVYRSLRDLERLGWIISDWQMVEGQGPPRRNYQITQKGKDVLKNWRKDLVKNQELISHLISMLDEMERS
jgi:DNA-binding PadR family transcriptional regulator